MVISKEEDNFIYIKADGEDLEQVDHFKYLGQTITPDGKNEKEIIQRIAISKSRFQQMYTLFTSRQISIKLRLRLLECYIFSVLLYGSETWTITKTLETKIEACEMWFIRRMGKISWKQKMTNEDVLTLMQTKRKILETIKQKKMSFFGHIKRHNGILKEILEGKMEGKRPRGRPRAQWTDNIKTWTNNNLKECTLMTQDRDLWRTISRQPLGRDGT